MELRQRRRRISAPGRGREKPLDELTVADLFEEYRELFCEDPLECGRQFYEDLLNHAAEQELLGYVQRRKASDAEGSVARNGSYRRKVITPVGVVEVEMPRIRRGGFESEVLPPYQRRVGSVEEPRLDRGFSGPA